MTDGKGVQAVLKDLNLNKDEVGKFEKAFKDPMFMEMFSEYAKEISNPQARAENDVYLRQLEKEGQVEATYGKGMELVMPEAQSVVKTKRVGSSEAVYMNICTSAKVEVAVGKRADALAGDAARGMHWDIPLMLGTARSGTDQRGQPCAVHDLVIHPDTLRMADANARFKDLVVESALEKVEVMASCKLARSWKPCRMRYKATPGQEQPHVLSFRTDGSSGGPLRPVANQQTDAKLAQRAEQLERAEQAGQPEDKPSFGFGFLGKGKAAGRKVMAPRTAADIGFAHPTGEVTPHYEVVQRGQADLAAAWGDVGRNLKLDTSLPKELVVRVDLPGLTNLAGAALDIARQHLTLQVAGQFKLDVSLPFKVDEVKGKAKFDKARLRLEVVLPVLPPPKPEPSEAPEQPGSSNPLIQELPDPPAAAQAAAQHSQTSTPAELHPHTSTPTGAPVAAPVLGSGDTRGTAANAATAANVAELPGDGCSSRQGSTEMLPDPADEFDCRPAAPGAKARGMEPTSQPDGGDSSIVPKRPGLHETEQLQTTSPTEEDRSCCMPGGVSSNTAEAACDAPAGLSATPTSSAACASVPQAQQLTENQRRWLELHKTVAVDTVLESGQLDDSDDDAPSAAGLQHATTSQQVTEPGYEQQTSAPGFQAASQFAGVRPGWVFKTGPQGLGYYLDNHHQANATIRQQGNNSSETEDPSCSGAPDAAPCQAPSATGPPAVQLKPRLRSRALADELD